MVSGVRAWMAGAALLGVIAVVGGAVISVTGDSRPGLPRVRGSVPGLDAEVDVFAQESEAVTNPEVTRPEVVQIDGIDVVQAAFDADHGHPRLILLVDPI